MRTVRKLKGREKEKKSASAFHTWQHIRVSQYVVRCRRGKARGKSHSSTRDANSSELIWRPDEWNRVAYSRCMLYACLSCKFYIPDDRATKKNRRNDALLREEFHIRPRSLYWLSKLRATDLHCLVFSFGCGSRAALTPVYTLYPISVVSLAVRNYFLPETHAIMHASHYRISMAKKEEPFEQERNKREENWATRRFVGDGGNSIFKRVRESRIDREALNGRVA